ncbi:MAG: dephospho-CoA kinase [Deltaproteobacteria bacterium]|nr:dephospho-CoA kinase [Deltaproteobacteria bacterium]PWB63354.1 MAG: dephospho-CoA kinase [Deltaproteobacteria bacterium]
MRIFGLTGGIGSGKSTVARMFREEGLAVIDADRIAREITLPGRPAYEAVLRAFGRGILLPNGRIDRRRLGDIVFADPGKRSELEAITHPEIARGIASELYRLESEGHNVALVEAALIFETGRRARFEAVITVRCGRDRQVRRLVKRDGMSEERILQRIASQMDPEEKARASEHVIDNSGDRAATRAQVRELAERIKSGSAP